MKNNLLQKLGCSVLLLVAAATSQAVTIDRVTVGNPGNLPDIPSGYGAVSSTYEIGKYEVSNAQYTEFLNAVADTDTYLVYNASMDTEARGGITRSGLSGAYSYAVKSGRGNNPVVFVNIYDSMRFVNWLQNGQPTGAQGLTTTEAGSYTMTGPTSVSGTRAPGASFALPSENEWYKAAYYQPFAMGGPVDSYWLYPMRNDFSPSPISDEPPGGDGGTDPSKAGNYNNNDGLANGYNDGYAVSGSPIYPTGNSLTDVGAYLTATSYYGTFDQGGNVQEWNEPVSAVGPFVLRGGSWDSSDFGLSSAARSVVGSTAELNNYGFRVAVVPEPTVGGMLLLGGALLWRRRR